MTVEQAKSATQKDIDAIRHALELFPRVAEVVKRFDGKMYNKRFNDAIRAAFPEERIVSGVSTYGGWLEVYYMHKGGGYNFYFIRLQLEKLENKRIKYNAFSENMKLQMFRLWNEARELERCLDMVDDSLAKIEKLEKDVSAIRECFPAAMRNYFRPPVYLQH